MTTQCRDTSLFGPVMGSVLIGVGFQLQLLSTPASRPTQFPLVTGFWLTLTWTFPMLIKRRHRCTRSGFSPDLGPQKQWALA